MKKFTLVVLTTLIQYCVVLATKSDFEGWVLAFVIIGNGLFVHSLVEWVNNSKRFDFLMDAMSVNIAGVAGASIVLTGSVIGLVGFLAFSLVMTIVRSLHP